jgi:ATP synthase protein I
VTENGAKREPARAGRAQSEIDKLRDDVAHQVARMQKAERERTTLLAQAAYLGTLGLLFILPVVAGAYLGRWLDDRASGYPIHWTIGMIFLGILVGAINVFQFIRRRM